MKEICCIKNRILALLLVVACCFSFFSCNIPFINSNNDQGDSGSPDIPSNIIPDNKENNDEENTPIFVPRSDDDKLTSGRYVKVSDVPANYIVSNANGSVTLSYKAPQISIGGIPDPAYNDGKFYRMNYLLSQNEGGNYYANHINKNVQTNNWHTSGGTIRFRTNAESITITATMQNAIATGDRFTLRGVAGFDVYVGTGTDRQYVGGRMQTFTSTSMVEETITLPYGVEGYNEVLINMPLYCGISNITITFPEDALIASPLSRDLSYPILFYGSSITQGACASRPGLAYTNMVCRMLNADCRNLGYSEGAYGEDEMIAYIANEQMSAFVMDYDHNATLSGLEETHYKLYKAVRDAHPDIPIVMLSRPVFTSVPDFAVGDEDLERIAIVKATYEAALAAGDENVYFINGYESFFPMMEMADIYTSDMRHPNDVGMYYMGLAVYKTLSSALKEK